MFAFALIEDMGIVDSIREPGGNITGVRYPGVDVALKRFEILHELVPDATRILVPYQRGYPIVQPQLESLRPIAEAAGVTLVEAPADNGTELGSILQEYVTADGVSFDAVLALVEPLSVAVDAYPVMVSFMAEHQLPFGGAYVPEGDYRPLFGVNVDVWNSGYQSATLADKIFQGIDPGTIPVASAETYLEIDYKMAEMLGLTVPEELLALADEVYR
ncbi:MAG: hypothetical protein H6669_13595 [Ardenticatenaceae bacterium]|nr:hypothetical protein [Ardenticatenaceae bacterium]